MIPEPNTDSPSTGPESTAPASASEPAPTPPPAPTEPSGPRTGPIVWGALILGFCGYVLQRTLAPGDLDTTTWITAVTIGLGVLLLGVGAAVLIRNHRRANRLADRRTTR